MRIRLLPLFALAACLLGASSCSVYYFLGKTSGLISAPAFDVNKEIPSDFHLSLDVRDVVSPPTDYVLEFDRTGKASYEVTVRSPRRKNQAGPFEVSEDQIRGLWKAVAAAQFDKLDPHYPKDGDGPDKKVGVQKYYVFADNTEHQVESRFVANDALESIRKAAVALVPPDAMKASKASGGTPKEFVGDMATHLFHMPDCPRLKDVPPANRQPFATPYEALNYQFKPCPECQPMPTNTK